MSVPGKMSALGHKQTSRDVRVTSALPPIADIRRMSWPDRFVPEADMVGRPIANTLIIDVSWRSLAG
jgi:hypothetical protein